MNAAGTLTVELIPGFSLEDDAGLHRALNHRISIVDVQVGRDRCSTVGFYPLDAVLRKLIADA